MPKCVIRSCKNSSNNIHIKDGVSFFHYPSDRVLAGRWWNIISHAVSASFKPRTAVVCSDHFQPQHKYWCRERRRLTRDAIPDPLLVPRRRACAMPLTPPDPESSDSDDEDTMIVDVPDIMRAPSESMVCRICLLSEGSMNPVSDDQEVAYRQVTGIKWDKEDALPQHLCWECASRLRAAAALKRRALAAHSLLTDIRCHRAYLTLNDVRSIDRRYHYLTSNLSQKHFPPNQYLSRTINNNKLFKTKELDNTKYIELSLNSMKQAIENTDVESTANRENINNSSVENAKNCELIQGLPGPINGDNGTHFTEKRENSLVQKSATDINDKSEDVKTDKLDVNDEDSSDCLVIDAEDNMETVIKSDYVNRNDEGMPIDELIDIYNNNGDGDERLQELNQQFEGAIVQIEQGWGGYRTTESNSVGDAPAQPPEIRSDTQTRSTKKRRRRAKPSQPISRAEYCLTKAYERLDRALFTVASVTDEQQIAELQQRQETIRFKEAPYKCMLCFRSFQMRRAHLAHMLRHDEKNGAYECIICKARQKSQRAMKTHMYGLHTVRISCNCCNFVTMNRSVARSHQKWHRGTIYQCQYCPSRYNQESTYKAHLRTQHVHAHVCAICGLTFVSAKGLAVHRCKRHADRDQILFLGPHCGECEVRFATDEAYSRHLELSSRHRTNNAPRSIELRVSGFPQY